VQPSGKLVEALSTCATGSSHLSDNRISTANGFLARVQYLLVSVYEKMHAIGFQAVAKIKVGLELCSPYKAQLSSFHHAVKCAILPLGTYAVVIKALRINVPALQSNAVIVSAARMLRGKEMNSTSWINCFAARQSHTFALGLIANFQIVAKRQVDMGFTFC